MPASRTSASSFAPAITRIRDRYRGATIPKRLRISFAVQLRRIGTADAVLAAEEFTAGEPFVVLNSDNYYPPALLGPCARQRTGDARVLTRGLAPRRQHSR